MTPDESLPATLGAGRYTVVRELGAGGMGIVYEAIENASGAHVALKMLPAVDPHALFGFKNEFRSLAALVHDNLVSLYELVSENDTWFFTMELVDGVDFLRYVRPGSGTKASGRPVFAELVNEERLRAALLQLADGMQALHGNGVLHRDIKPPNVLVRRDGRIAILDFGLAIALDETLDTSEHSSGTLGYMSPEQLGGDPLGPPTDWYAIGTMLYEALTGRPPFEGTPQQMFFAKAGGAVTPPREMVDGVPADLEALCLQMLHPDPTLRPDAAGVRACLTRDVRSTVRPDRDTRAFRLFVGRDDLLARLESALDVVRSGSTATVRVHGRSGAGKSALLEQFLLDARQDDAVVVFSGRCYEQESVPFKAVDSIVDAMTRWLLRRSDPEIDGLLPPDVAALARVFPVLERVPAIADAPRAALDVPDPRELRRRAFRALRALLDRIGRESLVIAAIDDLQWGDVDSAELLASLLERPDAPRLLLVLSFRSEYRDSSPCLQALDRALGDADAAVVDDVEVRPLDETTATLLAGALLTTRSEPVAARIASESGGNPFFIHELARYANENPDWLAQQGRGSFDLDRVVWDRVERLPAAARSMLELVAIAGQPVRNAHWRDATGDVTVDPQSFALLRFEHLIRSTGSSLDDEVETYHDRIRETVAAHTDAPARAGHHRRLALAMERHGDADAETIAVHFSEGGERERAGVHFGKAARVAEQKLAFDRAAGLYQRALAHRLEDDPERGPLHLALGRALGNAGRGREAAAAYEVAAGLTSDRGAQLDLLRQAALQYCTAGAIDQGRDLFATVMRGVGLRPTESSALILLQLLGRRGRLRLRGLDHEERREDDVPRDLLRRLDTLWAASTALSNVDVVRVAALQSQALLLALEAGEPRRLALALGWEAVLNATSGTRSAPRSRALIERAAHLVERTPDPHARGMIHLSRGWIAFLHADFPAALRECDSAEPIFRDQCTGVWWELVLTRTMTTWALSHCGRTTELARRIRELEPEARAQGNHFMVTNLLAFPIPIERLLAGDPDGSDAHLKEAMALWPYRGYHIQHVSVLFSRSLSLLYRGDAAGASDVVSQQWPAMVRSLQTQNQQTRVMLRDVRARGAARASNGTRGDYLARARRDLRSLAGEGAPWTDAYANRLRGCIAHAVGDMDGAIRSWRTAVAGLDVMGLTVQAAALRRRLGETLGGDEGRMFVSAADVVMRERRIADVESVTRMYT